MGGLLRRSGVSVPALAAVSVVNVSPVPLPVFAPPPGMCTESSAGEFDPTPADVAWALHHNAEVAAFPATTRMVLLRLPHVSCPLGILVDYHLRWALRSR